jgi:hypothetical protein
MAACPPIPLAAEVDESQPSQPNVVILHILEHQQLLDEVFMRTFVTAVGEQLGLNTPAEIVGPQRCPPALAYVATTIW